MVIKSHAKHRMQSQKRSWHNEAKYEKKVRRTFTPDEEVIATKKLRPLLPIKEKSGVLVKQFTDDDVQEKAVEENQISSVPENEMITAEKQVTLDPLTQAKMSLQDSKNKIAKICSDIVNDPEVTTIESSLSTIIECNMVRIHSFLTSYIISII